jgi:hypothetical protein
MNVTLFSLRYIMKRSAFVLNVFFGSLEQDTSGLRKGYLTLVNAK